MPTDYTLDGIPIIEADDIAGVVAPVPPTNPQSAVFSPVFWSKGLSPALAVEGYRRGCFPWPDEEAAAENLYPWGRLFPCTLLPTNGIHLPHAFKKRVRDALAGHYQGHPLFVLLDEDFDELIEALAAFHREKSGTWITDEMIRTWKALFLEGHAHSVSVYVDDELVGGLYFTSVGRMLYGESMFSRLDDTGKLALVALAAFAQLTHHPFIDCQMATQHVAALGAGLLPGERFLQLNAHLASRPVFDWSQARALSLLPFLKAAHPDLTPRPPSENDAKTSLIPESRLAVAGNLLLHVSAVQTPCSYFDTKVSTMEVVPLSPRSPQVRMLYNKIIDAGFRRDSTYLYRLDCCGCRRCTPTRIDVELFNPDATMRRIFRRNASLVMTERPLADITDEQYALYQRYQSVRHTDGSMGKMTKDEVNRVLFATCADTRILEFRTPSDAASPNTLKMVCIIDRLLDGISAVYTFYDPDAPALSLGTYGILSEIEYAKANHLRHLYLGYWLPAYPGMDYKTRFQPLEIYRDGIWRLQKDCPIDPAKDTL